MSNLDQIKQLSEEIDNLRFKKNNLNEEIIEKTTKREKLIRLENIEKDKEYAKTLVGNNYIFNTADDGKIYVKVLSFDEKKGYVICDTVSAGLTQLWFSKNQSRHPENFNTKLVEQIDEATFDQEVKLLYYKYKPI